MLNINDNDFHNVNDFENFFDNVSSLCGGTDYACGELSKISNNVKNIIKRNKEQITTNIAPQHTLLRARKAIAKELSHNSNDVEEIRFWKEYLDCYFANSGVRELQCAFIKQYGNIERNFYSNDGVGIRNGYLGYRKDKCGAPPLGNSKNGRCNKNGESVLYLGDTIETCLLECNACRKEIFSIGEFAPRCALTICDLTALAKIDYCGLWISEIFSYVSQENEYIKSQELTRIIKELGYDGVKYMSAKSTNGYCVAIFDPEKCESKRSYLVKPSNVVITYEC